MKSFPFQRAPRFGVCPVRSRRRGVSTVEFALVVPVLLALLMSILEFSIVTRNNLTLSNCAREGARALALGHTTTDAKTRMKSMSGVLNLQDSAIAMTYSTDNGATFSTGVGTAAVPNTIGDNDTQNNAPLGSLVKVAIRYPHKSLTGFFPFLNGYILKTNAVFRRES